jgi:hypothetical protein
LVLMMRVTRYAPLFALFAGLTIAACSDNEPTGSQDGPLAGLAQREGSDSLGQPLPPQPPNPQPGVFRGFVLAPCTSGCTGDTLATAPRIAGVVVKAYPVTAGSGTANPTLGDLAATATTGSDGKFQLPSLTGEFVVTFTPPASSPYGGVWVTAHTTFVSDEYPWWVVLPLK